MSSKKRQHYVPRFYLKLFNAGTNSIGLWNISSAKYVKCASISKQAYGKRIYGSDPVVENGLAYIESMASKVLNEIIASGGLPQRISDDDIALRMYIVFQAERTKYKAEEMNEMVGKFTMAIMEKHPNFKEEMRKVTISMKDPALLSLYLANQYVPFCFDLEMMLLRNRTGTPFITSDNPVVRYNQFLEERAWPGSHCGWAMKGLQVMLPLNGSNYLIMYDSSRYCIGERKEAAVNIVDTRDVSALNGLQFLNADENVYFGPGVDELYMSGMHGLNITKRRRQKVSLRKFRQVFPAQDPYSTLLSFGSFDIKTNLALTFCKMTKHAKQEELGPSAALYRSEGLRQLHESMKQADIEGAEVARMQRGVKPPGESTT